MFKYIFALLTALGLALAFCEASTTPATSLQPQYVNLYESPIYSSSNAQMKRFVETYPSNTLREFSIFNSFYVSINSQFEPSLNSHNKALSNYTLFKHLREALRTSQAGQNPKFIDDFTHWFFTEKDIAAATKEFMEATASLNPEFYTAAYLADPERYLVNLNEYVNNLLKFRENKKSAVRTKEDNYLHGDYPSKLYTLHNTKQTQMVRLPNVAHDLELDEKGFTSKAEVNPEFRNYVQVLARNNKTHFYVNVLSRDRNEKVKSREIESLEDDPITQNGIYVITLDKDHYSPFYYQLPPFDTQDKAQLFMEDFLNRMRQPDGAYYWSKKMERATWFEQLALLLQEVHERHFGSREMLTQIERQDFIELTYLKIIDTLAMRFQPDYMNITCKQAVDRGPSLYALYYLVDHAKKGTIGDHERAEFLYFMLAPPLAYHDRGAHSYRVERAQGAANRLMQAGSL